MQKYILRSKSSGPLELNLLCAKDNMDSTVLESFVYSGYRMWFALEGWRGRGGLRTSYVADQVKQMDTHCIMNIEHRAWKIEHGTKEHEGERRKDMGDRKNQAEIF